MVTEFKDLTKEETKRIRDREHRKQKIVEERGLQCKNSTEKRWFHIFRKSKRNRISVDEIVRKIFEGEQDFRRIVLVTLSPNLSGHEGFQEMKEYLRLKTENYYPFTGYFRFDNSNLRHMIAKGLYLPNFYAPGANLEKCDFTGAVLPNLYFDEKTKLAKAKFIDAELSGLSYRTRWSKVDVKGTQGKVKVGKKGKEVIEEMTFDECDITGIKNLEKSCFVYDNFIKVIVSPPEEGYQGSGEIIDNMARRIPYFTPQK